ncbi:MAG TPA: VOC family protein [Sphingobium sp.]
MVTVLEEQIASGRGTLVRPSEISHLAIGNLVTLDLVAARRRYEHLFAFECVEYAPGRMMARDRRAKHLMETGVRDFFLLDIVEVDTIEHPQAMANHWGFSVSSREEVDRIREKLVKKSQEYGLRKIHPALNMHNSYGFYLIDADENWWEVECRGDIKHEVMFSRGDWDASGREDFPMVSPPLDISTTASQVFGPEAFMTHGTTAVISTRESQHFYEDVLGLRYVRHGRPSSLFAGASDFAIVGLNSGDKIQDQGVENRFTILVDSEEELERLHAHVKNVRETFGLQHVTGITDGEFGGRAFLLRSKDQIWFEISSRSRQSYVDLFKSRQAEQFDRP